MKNTLKLSFMSSDSDEAKNAMKSLTAVYGQVEPDKSDIIITLGGDGFMLETLNLTQHLNRPVYGMNCGTVGFLMNEFSVDSLHTRLERTQEELVNPLRMTAVTEKGIKYNSLAINEVSLLRGGPQAAKLKVSVDGKVRLKELVCDGALVCTPAGSTAYNYSAHGPILPIGSDVLALTAISAFRPRRWRGALLPKIAKVRLDVLESEKRPVRAFADSRAAGAVISVEIETDPKVKHRILFDPGHGLDERLISEQFV